MKKIRDEKKLVANIKKIEDLFLSCDFPYLETNDFKNNGLFGTITFYG